MTSRNPIGQFTANAAGASWVELKASWVELKRLRTVVLHKEAKIMDLPNLVEFKVLLQEDRIFRDYLNVFLNLPVSCRETEKYLCYYICRDYEVAFFTPTDILKKIYLQQREEIF